MLKRIFILGFLLLLSACTVEQGGGVGVGNGMVPTYVTYESPKYDFGFRYNSKLTFTQITEERVEIDNRALVTRPNLPMSTLVVEVVKVPLAIGTAKQLLNFAQSAHPALGLNFRKSAKPIPLGDLVFANLFPAKISAGLHRIYYLLTANQTLVRVSLNSPQSSPGWENIAEIVEKFNRDFKAVTP